jgi:hypothetical protein
MKTWKTLFLSDMSPKTATPDGGRLEKKKISGFLQRFRGGGAENQHPLLHP